RKLWRPPDAAGVEQPLAIVVYLIAVDGELIDARALEKERPLLLQEGLEHREVEDGGVLFDLPEVGVHGTVEREVRREAVLEVGTAREVLMAFESGRRGSRLVLRHHLGQHVELAWGRDAVDAREITQLRDKADLGRPIRRPGHPLLVALDVAPDTETEGVRGRGRIAKLGKGDRELRRPSERVHACGDVPD